MLLAEVPEVVRWRDATFAVHVHIAIDGHASTYNKAKKKKKKKKKKKNNTLKKKKTANKKKKKTNNRRVYNKKNKTIKRHKKHE
eukprot:NODE_8458_length_1494_cov_8.111924.p5 GENE.NODE_8458_length_1494_cov_8.111924~~NODE_8458_length_1494_cov_8.111924.p5  ORF type:complete len:84 (-),score=48.44 NODE_8458_length_1494_cov_8.111924:26-277(-)